MTAYIPLCVCAIIFVVNIFEINTNSVTIVFTKYLAFGYSCLDIIFAVKYYRYRSSFGCISRKRSNREGAVPGNNANTHPDISENTEPVYEDIEKNVYYENIKWKFDCRRVYINILFYI